MPHGQSSLRIVCWWYPSGTEERAKGNTKTTRSKHFNAPGFDFESLFALRACLWSLLCLSPRVLSINCCNSTYTARCNDADANENEPSLCVSSLQYSTNWLASSRYTCNRSRLQLMVITYQWSTRALTQLAGAFCSSDTACLVELGQALLLYTS